MTKTRSYKHVYEYDALFIHKCIYELEPSNFNYVQNN